MFKLKFKVDSEYCTLDFETREKCLRTADSILRATRNYSLLGELNDMQMEADSLNNPTFKNKFTIPNYFINLVLKPFNMKIEVDMKIEVL